MSDAVSVCTECGARLAPGATRCDLCGAEQGAAAPADVTPTMPTPVPAATEKSVFCNACGWRNPPGSRFCSQCGAPLEVHAAARPPAPADGASGTRIPSSAPVGRTLAIVLGSAVLLVVALFVITAMSEGRSAPPTPAAAATGTSAAAPAAQVFAPLAPEQEQAVARLEDTLDAADASARPGHLRELVNLLVGFGRPDLAAQAQEDLARLEPSAAAWRRAGDLYFEWLRVLEDRDENPQPVALRVIPAYVTALETEEDSDVRARLAWAYQYDPANPMKAIEETRAVLDRDSTHVGATYNYAYFLMRIGRTDQAIEQMEKVKRLAGADSALVRHADAFIASLRAAPQP